jgi:acetyl esterase/lipase
MSLMRVGLLVSGVCLLGCPGNDADPLDAGRAVDSGVLVDSGLLDAAGSAGDAGAAADAGRVADSGPAPDAGPDDGTCRLTFARGEVHRDVPYARLHPRQVMDVVQTTARGRRPTLVWIHGGGWRAGSKSLPTFGDWSARGYVVVALGYRFSDQDYPAAMLDVKAAIRFLRANAEAYGIDRDRIVVMGSSSGGHLAAFLGATGGLSIFDDAVLGNLEHSSAVNLVVNYYGPTSILDLDVDERTEGCEADRVCHLCEGSAESELLGCLPEACRDTAEQASPITHLDAHDPPFLTIHGTADCSVPTEQSRRFHQAAQAAGVDSTLIESAGAGHNVRECNSRGVEDRVIAFVEQRLRGCLHEAPDVTRPEDAQLSECLYESCGALAQACEANALCVAVDWCVRQCFADTPERNCTEACFRDLGCPPDNEPRPPECIDETNRETVIEGLYHPLYACGDRARCYPRH